MSPCDLMCISQMTNDIENFPMSLLDVYRTSLEKPVFGSFAHLELRLFVFFLVSCKNPLYSLDTSPLPDVRFTNFLSHLAGGLTFYMVDGIF